MNNGSMSCIRGQKPSHPEPTPIAPRDGCGLARNSGRTHSRSPQPSACTSTTAIRAISSASSIALESLLVVEDHHSEIAVDASKLVANSANSKPDHELS